jgi:hypothetical protein
MKKAEMRKASSKELVQRYEQLAAERGTQLESGSSEAANRAFQEETTIERELGRRGEPSLGLLLPLLKSANPWVRLDAAVPALFFAAEEAVPVLDELGSHGKALGFTAKFTLKQWRSGKLDRSF